MRVTPYKGVTSLAGKQVKGGTCIDFVKKKSRATRYYLASTFRNLKQPDLLPDKFDRWVIKQATSLFSSF